MKQRCQCFLSFIDEICQIQSKFWRLKFVFIIYIDSLWSLTISIETNVSTPYFYVRVSMMLWKHEASFLFCYVLNTRNQGDWLVLHAHYVYVWAYKCWTIYRSTAIAKKSREETMEEILGNAHPMWNERRHVWDLGEAALVVCVTWVGLCIGKGLHGHMAYAVTWNHHTSTDPT